ncbi:hypothetical protein BLA29_005648, partial [Euroglyphus maynei]
MLYLTEILTIFGLILLLILLVRISLWLLHCSLCSKSSDAESGIVEFDNNHQHQHHDDDDVKKSSINNDKQKKSEKTKQKQKVKKETKSSTTPPPSPVPKPDFLKNDDQQQLNSADLSSEPNQPEFRIVSESQLPKPDGDDDDGQDLPTTTVNETSVIMMNQFNSIISNYFFSKNPEIKTEETAIKEESDAIMAEVIIESLVINDEKIDEQQQQEPSSHTYAQIIRKTDDQRQSNDENVENVAITMDDNDKPVTKTSEYAVVDIELKKPSEEQENQEQENQYEKIKTMDIEVVDLDEKEPEEVDEQTTMENINQFPEQKSVPQIVKRVPAHRCICPYCSSNYPAATTTASKRSSLIDNEEREVLKLLNETLEEMERLNESLAPLAKQQIIENQTTDQQQERTNNNDSTLQSSSDNNNDVYILEPKQLNAYSTLIRNRIRVYEPEHPDHP